MDRSRGLRGGPKRCIVQLNMVTITEDKKKKTNMHHSRLAVATIAGLGYDQNKRKRLP